MEAEPNLHEYTAKRFVEYCRLMLRWTDLSRDVIMDVGCGEEGNCGKAIIERFTDVGAIIFIDNKPRVRRNFQLKVAAKIECVIADIEKRDTLRNYEGKMSKVVSTNVFHQLKNKEEAFRNVYHLLKPGGEAAVLFIKRSLMYEWLTEMLKKPKWNEAYKNKYIQDMYDSAFGADQYRKMVEEIGFQVIECKEEEETVIPYPSDQICKDSLYQMVESSFDVPPEVLEEFKEDCLQVLLQLSARDSEGRPCYRTTELSALLTKPKEGSSSKTTELGS